MRHALSITLEDRERTWGIRYLFFSYFFLGPILVAILPLIFREVKKIHMDTVYLSVNLVAVCVIFRSFLKRSIRKATSSMGKLLIALAIGLVSCVTVNVGLNMLYTLLVPGLTNLNDDSIRINLQENFILTGIGTVLLAPLAEEVLYRGLIFTMLHPKSRVLAYSVSTLIFCYIHVSAYIGVYTLPQLLLNLCLYIPAGLILAWSYEYSGSILTPVWIHTGVNAVAMIIMRCYYA